MASMEKMGIYWSTRSKYMPETKTTITEENKWSLSVMGEDSQKKKMCAWQ